MTLQGCSVKSSTSFNWRTGVCITPRSLLRPLTAKEHSHIACNQRSQNARCPGSMLASPQPGSLTRATRSFSRPVNLRAGRSRRRSPTCAALASPMPSQQLQSDASQQGGKLVSAVDLRLFLLPAAIAALVAFMPPPLGAVFLTCVMGKLVAPALAIWGLLQGKTSEASKLAKAGQTMLAVGLYAYMIMMTMPGWSSVVSLDFANMPGPASFVFSTILPAGASKWLASSIAAPVAFRSAALETSLGIFAAYLAKPVLLAGIVKLLGNSPFWQSTKSRDITAIPGRAVPDVDAPRTLQTAEGNASEESMKEAAGEAQTAAPDAATADEAGLPKDRKTWWHSGERKATPEPKLPQADKPSEYDPGSSKASAFTRTVVDSLESHSPDIAAEWHPVRNGSLMPSQVWHKTEVAVWWQCPNSKPGQLHEWSSAVSARTCSQRPFYYKVADRNKYEVAKSGNFHPHSCPICAEQAHAAEAGLNSPQQDQKCSEPELESQRATMDLPPAVTECQDMYAQVVGLLKLIQVQVTLQGMWVTCDKICIEPMFQEEIPLAVYLRQEQHRLRLWNAQLRSAQEEKEGEVEDTALIDSMTSGLKAAIPRLTIARDALAVWLQSGQPGIVNLRASPDKGESSREASGAEKLNTVQDTKLQSSEQGESVQLKTGPVSAVNWGHSKGSLSSDQVLGQMVRDPYAVPSFGGIIARSKPGSLPSGSMLANGQDWKRLEVLGKTLVDRLASKISSAPTAASAAPADAPSPDHEALVTALTSINATLQGLQQAVVDGNTDRKQLNTTLDDQFSYATAELEEIRHSLTHLDEQVREQLSDISESLETHTEISEGAADSLGKLPGQLEDVASQFEDMASAIQNDSEQNSTNISSLSHSISDLRAELEAARLGREEHWASQASLLKELSEKLGGVEGALSHAPASDTASSLAAEEQRLSAILGQERHTFDGIFSEDLHDDDTQAEDFESDQEEEAASDAESDSWEEDSASQADSDPYADAGSDADSDPYAEAESDAESDPYEEQEAGDSEEEEEDSDWECYDPKEEMIQLLYAAEEEGEDESAFTPQQTDPSPRAGGAVEEETAGTGAGSMGAFSSGSAPAQSATPLHLSGMEDHVWVRDADKTTWVLVPESDQPAALADDGQDEGEEVPVEHIVHNVHIDFADPEDEPFFKPAPTPSEAASARMTAAFQDKDDQWSPDSDTGYQAPAAASQNAPARVGAAPLGRADMWTSAPARDEEATRAVSQAASARMTAAFLDKDDQFDPDADLERLSDRFEQDEEADAFFRKPLRKPEPSPSKYTNFFVEGDPTCG